MPIYMDVHPGLGDATPDDVAEAHRHDLEVQDQFGVRFLSYWFSDPQGKAFCLAESPDIDSLVACHKAAHGLMPHEVIEVEAPTLAQFMGATATDSSDRVTVSGQPDTALRAIMFTDIEGSTDISTSHGDTVAVELVRRHNEIVRAALNRFGGREVKHTGDGLFASFTSVTSAVEATVAIQRDATETSALGPTLAIKIGLSAGEPVEDSQDLFGAAVNLAARICAHARGGRNAGRRHGQGPGHRQRPPILGPGCYRFERVSRPGPPLRGRVATGGRLTRTDAQRSPRCDPRLPHFQRTPGNMPGVLSGLLGKIAECCLDGRPVVLKGGPAAIRQRNDRAGLSTTELLVDLHVAVFFEFAQVGREIPPGETGRVAEERRIGLFDDVQLGDQPQPGGGVDDWIDG